MEYDLELFEDSFWSNYPIDLEKYKENCEDIDNAFDPTGAGILPSDEEKYEELMANERKTLFDSFDKDYNEFVEQRKYFYGCPSDIYKETYSERLKDFLSTFSDASEIDFIEYELNKGILYSTSGETKRKILYSLKKRNLILKEKGKALGYEISVEEKYDEEGGFMGNVEIIKTPPLPKNKKTSNNFPIPKHGLGNGIEKKQSSKIKLQISQTELVELVKALVENNNLQGTQKEAIRAFSEFFEMEIKNPDKTIQDLKNRKNGGETLFLDRLKTSLYDYIQQGKEKNTR